MTPDRERIEREVEEIAGELADAAMPTPRWLSGRIAALVLRERAAALEMAAEKLSESRLTFIKDNPPLTIDRAMWSQSLFVAEEKIRALAAQERGQ